MHKKNIFLRIALMLLIATLSTGGVFVGSGTIAKFIAQAPVVASATAAGFNVQIRNSAGFSDDGVWMDESDWVDFDQANAATKTIADLFVDFGKGQASIYCTDPWGTDECHVALDGECDHDTDDFDDDDFDDCEECYTQGELIAPGTMGKMELTFNNLSDVSVKFYLETATFTGVNNANLKFFVITSDDEYGDVPNVKFDSSMFPEDEDEFSVPLANLVGRDKATVTIHPQGEPKTIFVWWIWPFEIAVGVDSNGDPDTSVQDGLDTGLGLAAAKSSPIICTATFNVKAEQVD